MNRKTFFQKIAWISGIFVGFPAFISGKGLISHEEGAPNISNSPIQKGDSDGYDPDISITPWGQNVFYDQYTYSDLQKSMWRKD